MLNWILLAPTTGEKGAKESTKYILKIKYVRLLLWEVSFSSWSVIKLQKLFFNV